MNARCDRFTPESSKELVHYLRALHQYGADLFPVGNLRGAQARVPGQPHDLFHRHARGRQQADKSLSAIPAPDSQRKELLFSTSRSSGIHRGRPKFSDGPLLACILRRKPQGAPPHRLPLQRLLLPPAGPLVLQDFDPSLSAHVWILNTGRGECWTQVAGAKLGAIIRRGQAILSPIKRSIYPPDLVSGHSERH
jgi:hypothetical protein